MSKWTPPDWWYIDTKPSNDSAYFENLTRCIFQAGLNWQVVTMKWENFQNVFHNFNIKIVAAFNQADVKQLISNSDIIRNKRKIESTIYNAQEFQRIANEAGTFQTWIDALDKSSNYAGVVKQLITRFKHVGQMTAHTFLHSVGEDIQYESAVYGSH
ncbi:MAG: DNA-3-methyladenine glycosylase I [Candidatus Bathyarchaeota archaeon]|nr:DNA-3-methyladenine glycosylase I [Candidatus Bathyarchaeota archaeon]